MLRWNLVSRHIYLPLTSYSAPSVWEFKIHGILITMKYSLRHGLSNEVPFVGAQKIYLLVEATAWVPATFSTIRKPRAPRAHPWTYRVVREFYFFVFDSLVLTPSTRRQKALSKG